MDIERRTLRDEAACVQGQEKIKSKENGEISLREEYDMRSDRRKERRKEGNQYMRTDGKTQREDQGKGRLT